MSPEVSFLDLLLQKLSYVQQTAEQTSNDLSAAIKETERQISQALRNNPITGEGVTKSGEED